MLCGPKLPAVQRWAHEHSSSKLAAAVQAGHLTSDERKTLEAAILAGNAAAHRGFTPSEQQIEDVLGIVEHLLQGRYVWGQAATRLRSQVPRRKP